MPESTLAKKLLLKAGQRAAILNPPAGYQLGPLGPLPSNVTVLNTLEEPLDFVQLFVRSGKEVAALIPAVMRALKPDGLLWVSYPKGSSGVDTDLNRDILWKMMQTFGLAGIAMVSIDSVWSAIRLRPAERVGK